MCFDQCAPLQTSFLTLYVGNFFSENEGWTKDQYDEGRANRVIANRGLLEFLSTHNLWVQRKLKLGISQTGIVSTWIEQKNGKVCKCSCKCQQLALWFKRKMEEQKEGARQQWASLCEGSKTGKSAWAWISSLHASNWLMCRISFCRSQDLNSRPQDKCAERGSKRGLLHITPPGW